MKSYPNSSWGASCLLWKSQRLRSLFGRSREEQGARTFIDTPLDRVPCGNSIGLLQLSAGIRATLTGAALASSFVFDWALRRRVAGTNINSFFLWEAAWPRSSSVPGGIVRLVIEPCVCGSALRKTVAF